MVKKILSILAWVVTAGALVALFIVAREHCLDTPVRSVSLDIERDTDSGFVKQNAVLAGIGNLSAKAKIGTVNMEGIRKQLTSNPWIESSSAYIDLDANLNVSIKEYEPVMRIYSNSGQSAYLTADGILLPSSTGYTPHVLIASGNFDFDLEQPNHKLIDTLESDRNLISAMKVFEAIQRNGVMKSRIGQVYCNGRNEFELVDKSIAARIVMGDTCNIDDKLRRLEIFIEQKANSAEIRNYKKIDLQYKNQIVCTKR